MARTFIAPDDQPADSSKNSKQAENHFHLVSSSETLRSNVNTVLSMINALSPLTIDPEATKMSDYNTGVAAYDKKARCAAADTITVACARLDQMLVNNELWKTDAVNKIMDKRTKEINLVNVAAAKARALNAFHENRPSVRMGCTISRHSDGSIVAYLGHSKLTAEFVGRGRTLTEALDALDNLLEPK